jgi:hypothetical protein
LYYVKSCTDSGEKTTAEKGQRTKSDTGEKSGVMPNGIDHAQGDARNQPEEKSLIHHFPISIEHSDAIDLIKWCFAVANMRADSPRFNYYVSRWDIPGKIKAAKAAGYFDSAVEKCPPFDPAWIRFVPAALSEHRKFMQPKTRAPEATKLLIADACPPTMPDAARRSPNVCTKPAISKAPNTSRLGCRTLRPRSKALAI